MPSTRRTGYAREPRGRREERGLQEVGWNGVPYRVSRALNGSEPAGVRGKDMHPDILQLHMEVERDHSWCRTR